MKKNEKPLLVIEYDTLGRIGILMFRVFAVIFGLFLLLVDNYFVNLFAVLSIFFGVIDFFNILLFDKLTFYDDELIKESSIYSADYSRKLKYTELEVSVSKGLFGGSLMFWEKGRRWKTAWFFRFDLFPVSNDEFLSIRKILIEKEIIKGDQHGWNY